MSSKNKHTPNEPSRLVRPPQNGYKRAVLYHIRIHSISSPFPRATGHQAKLLRGKVRIRISLHLETRDRVFGDRESYSFFLLFLLDKTTLPHWPSHKHGRFSLKKRIGPKTKSDTQSPSKKPITHRSETAPLVWQWVSLHCGFQQKHSPTTGTFDPNLQVVRAGCALRS